MRNLIDFGDMSREEWEQLYARASQIIDDPSRFIDVCRGKVSANLFYEPSTRTNFSFQTAMLRLEHVGYGPTGDPIFMDITSSIGERYVMQVAQGFYR